MDASELITRFGLALHPEGGWYRETYRSQGVIPEGTLKGFSGPRSVCTGILFLLAAGERSCLHRIRQDEMWHFYLGGPLRLAVLSPAGDVRVEILGQDVLSGQHVHYTVPAGHWFGAAPCPGTSFSLVGCTVAPGFDFADLEMGDRERLETAFPEALACIREFCR